ncbi:MAG: deoxyribodipyrimidine photo-lyase [Anaerolineae bacterium]
MSDSAPVLCWFRRDLRLDDHLALAAAIKSGQPVIPVFIFDPNILKSERFSPARYQFMLNALESMRSSLRKHQRDLLIRHGEPLQMLKDIVRETGATKLFFNVDYTPYARQRDDQVISTVGIPVETCHDRLLAPPGTIEKNEGGPYVVYTPFKNKWRKQVKPDQSLDYKVSAATLYPVDNFKGDNVPTLKDLGYENPITVPEASETHAQRRLEDFMQSAIFDYKEARNRLGNPVNEPHTGTSFLSPYIRFGLLSLRYIYWRARQAHDEAKSTAQRESVVAFMDEIVWHEFYTHILWEFPQVKSDNFASKFDIVPWRDDEDALQAWKEGKTGYPIVDAAMRQLKGAGWMHNRARMIVASFLTKDLLIHWRPGELYFMQNLLDGDLAANNGGWQWAAGTGTDAQPYFRIFNPVSQSEKFDPDGAYIRYWVPELRDVPDAFIHEPWKMDNPPADYPAPIVDHGAARERALAAFDVMKEKA